MHDQFQAIRHRLWILNTTLESLPVKIELGYRLKSDVAGVDASDQRRLTPDTSGGKRLAFKVKGALADCWARWKLARLRARADWAERRAVVAIHSASASFGAALDAVVHAAIVYLKADRLCVGCPTATLSVEGSKPCCD